MLVSKLQEKKSLPCLCQHPSQASPQGAGVWGDAIPGGGELRFCCLAISAGFAPVNYGF